ncbi:MAG: hypothetical protein KKA99_07005 [Gammaproteobacteria bacterium]|nr:hypothetical protein [Gammaproteobacteria bacterium]MBU1345310.1 hypothetical protein [Pseudomonadota bacterium]MBU1629435.1 hypothetical protein [Gammaproteobacteria bacterium]MBU1927316.1 hypothetical protein [Gammaproteobacteria bacterium]
MKTNKEYTSSDFYLTAYLLASGLELIGTTKTDPHRTLFILRDIPEREALIQSYYAGKGSVNPLAYKDKIQNLKAMLHNNY